MAYGLRMVILTIRSPFAHNGGFSAILAEKSWMAARSQGLVYRVPVRHPVRPWVHLPHS